MIQEAATSTLRGSCSSEQDVAGSSLYASVNKYVESCLEVYFFRDISGLASLIIVGISACLMLDIFPLHHTSISEAPLPYWFNLRCCEAVSLAQPISFSLIRAELQVAVCVRRGAHSLPLLSS